MTSTGRSFSSFLPVPSEVSHQVIQPVSKRANNGHKNFVNAHHFNEIVEKNHQMPIFMSEKEYHLHYC